MYRWVPVFLAMGMVLTSCQDTIGDKPDLFRTDSQAATDTHSDVETDEALVETDTEMDSEETGSTQGPDTNGTDTTGTDESVDPFAQCIPNLGEGGTQEAKAVTGLDGRALEYTWSRTSGGHESFLWIEVFEGFEGPREPGTYVITEKEASYATCGLCIVAQGEDGVYYMPVPGSGQVVLDDLTIGSPREETRFAGSMELEMRAVELDTQTFETAIIEDGCFGLVTHSWDAQVR